jgi:hypothetical protein
VVCRIAHPVIDKVTEPVIWDAPVAVWNLLSMSGSESTARVSDVTSLPALLDE